METSNHIAEYDHMIKIDLEQTCPAFIIQLQINLFLPSKGGN